MKKKQIKEPIEEEILKNAGIQDPTEKEIEEAYKDYIGTATGDKHFVLIFSNWKAVIFKDKNTGDLYSLERSIIDGCCFLNLITQPIPDNKLIASKF